VGEIEVSGLLALGVPYELAGLVFFVLYLAMSRPRAAGRFSRRSQVLVLLAAIALVAGVPLHYGARPGAMAFVLLLVLISLVSTVVDARRRPPTRR
jgi:hypothetical protein